MALLGLSLIAKGLADPIAAADEGADSPLSLLFRSSKERAFGREGLAPASLCSLAPEDGRTNIIVMWPHHPDEFGQLAYAAVESALFHHPSANLVIVSPFSRLPTRPLDAYLLEGYCVVSVALEEARVLPLPAAVGEAVARSTQRSSVSKEPDQVLPFLNYVALALQVSYGGISFQIDGMLLNPFDFMLPRDLSLRSTAVFLERLVPQDQPPIETALQAADFEQSWLPRSFVDRADGYTFLCLDISCPRSVPAHDALGRALLEAALHGLAQDWSEMATSLYRGYVRQRPAAVPITSQGITLNHEIAVLPFWVHVEPHFSDGWKSYGGHDDLNAVHSQLYSPRPQRESADWSLVSSSKLWLPLGFGPPSARNILRRSVVDMALRYFTLGIMPRPYASRNFGRPASSSGSSSYRLRSPRDAHHDLGMDVATAARGEAALPGAAGGFRTFRQLRLVGRSAQAAAFASNSSHGDALGVPRPWRIVVSSAAPALDMYCRREQRPTKAPRSRPAARAAAVGSAALRACEAALLLGRSSAGGVPQGAGGPSGLVPLFDMCGSAGELNAALTLLAYKPIAGLGSPAPARRQTRSLRPAYLCKASTNAWAAHSWRPTSVTCGSHCRRRALDTTPVVRRSLGSTQSSPRCSMTWRTT